MTLQEMHFLPLLESPSVLPIYSHDPNWPDARSLGAPRHFGLWRLHPSHLHDVLCVGSTIYHFIDGLWRAHDIPVMLPPRYMRSDLHREEARVKQAFSAIYRNTDRYPVFVRAWLDHVPLLTFYLSTVDVLLRQHGAHTVQSGDAMRDWPWPRNRNAQASDRWHFNFKVAGTSSAWLLQDAVFRSHRAYLATHHPTLYTTPFFKEACDGMTDAATRRIVLPLEHYDTNGLPRTMTLSCDALPSTRLHTEHAPQEDTQAPGRA